jgi:hypothetical protein
LFARRLPIERRTEETRNPEERGREETRTDDLERYYVRRKRRPSDPAHPGDPAPQAHAGDETERDTDDGGRADAKKTENEFPREKDEHADHDEKANERGE